MLDDYLECMPLGRVGTVEDIAALARFLVGPESTWITGQLINADGGHQLTRGPSYRSIVEPLYGADGLRGLVESGSGRERQDRRELARLREQRAVRGPDGAVLLEEATRRDRGAERREDEVRPVRGPGWGSSARKWIVRSTVGTNTGSSTRLNVGGIHASVIAAATSASTGRSSGSRIQPPATARAPRGAPGTGGVPIAQRVSQRCAIGGDSVRHGTGTEHLRTRDLRHHEIAELEPGRGLENAPSASATSFPCCSSRAEHEVSVPAAAARSPR